MILGVPSNLTATVISSSKVQFSWDVNLENSSVQEQEPPIVQITYSNGNLIAEPSLDITSFEVPNPPKGTYSFFVCFKYKINGSKCTGSNIIIIEPIGTPTTSQVPEITSLISFPKTFKYPHRIRVEWSSAGNNEFHLMWGLSTRIDYYPQIGGNSGLFVSPTNPGLTYRFKVQGINTSAYDVSWSAWSNPKEVQAVAPLHSLRQFFAEIDLNQGIRSHLPNKMGNLRILMGL